MIPGTDGAEALAAAAGALGGAGWAAGGGALSGAGGGCAGSGCAGATFVRGDRPADAAALSAPAAAAGVAVG